MTRNFKAGDSVLAAAAWGSSNSANGAAQDTAPGQASDESTLRLQARQALEAGKLPARPAEDMWGGPGLGQCCAVCGAPVRHEELGFELEFVAQDDVSRLDNYHLHIRCFAAWEFERQHAALPAPSDDGTISGREHDQYRRGSA